MSVSLLQSKLCPDLYTLVSKSYLSGDERYWRKQFSEVLTELTNCSKQIVIINDVSTPLLVARWRLSNLNTDKSYTIEMASPACAFIRDLLLYLYHPLLERSLFLTRSFGPNEVYILNLSMSGLQWVCGRQAHILP